MAARFYLDGREIGLKYDDTDDRTLSVEEAQVVALALIAKAIEDLAAAQRSANSLAAKQGQ